MGKAKSEGSLAHKGRFSLEREYARTIDALERAGVLITLTRAKSPGVIGVDGKGYPVPTLEQVRESFAHNRELIGRKMRQGFAQLQLTPMAMPVPRLVEIVHSAVLERAAIGKIVQVKQDPANADIPVRVHTAKSPWVWEVVRQALDTPALVYFPSTHDRRDHHGLSKEEVMRDTSLCAVPGWSVGLIEPIAVMPQQGQGKTRGGRRQLEAYSTPREYLRTLSAPAYEGETGWTPEDFLTHFVTWLEATGQVMHARYDGNALWLLGSYLPDVGRRGLTDIVPVGYWDHGRMYVSAHRAGNMLQGVVARSMVRLGA